MNPENHPTKGRGIHYDKNQRPYTLEVFHPDAYELYVKDVWGEHPDHRREAWRQEAHEGNTQRGYWSWVSAQLEEQAQENGR